ncbi:homoserine dehydrogenase [Candidatus Methylopumilus rimovensis]|jgi:homoserine dehydrogenase|uniref:homoserine dehydrogenase n=1 Tax=Candidatus Methylopumilus rimovensis TaxID=2588535 RepID=UPI001120BC1D|nr:homoserine dehydrogenase [Candidatus Methylopumilus rimovensis]QDD12307.1 homoserine dehydrogenase [Candidatus Methylopumilus rimovensis]
MKRMNIGLLGIGTVGGGVFELLKSNIKEIQRKTSVDMKIVAVADKNIARAKEIVGSAIEVTDDAFKLVADKEIDVIVELIGGTTIAKDLVMKAIENKKHVVTANKALLANFGNELFQLAKKNNVTLAFEASVAGGIPILKSIREGLAGNKIEWVAGIINGTTNFILTEMREKGISFAKALSEAQSLGYAEADPTFDIEGIDAAHKLTILAGLSFGIPMSFKDVYVEGIKALEQKDIRYAEELGYRIKLLGIAKKRDQGIELRVHPTLIPEKRLIANVNGAMNAVVVKGNMVGPTLYYGAGAGALPTASAVVADLIDISRSSQVPLHGFDESKIDSIPIYKIDDAISGYYLRIRVSDKPGVLAEITKLFGDKKISIDAMLQKEPQEHESEADIVILSHLAVEKDINAVIYSIESLSATIGKVIKIRLEELSK